MAGIGQETDGGAAAAPDAPAPAPLGPTPRRSRVGAGGIAYTDRVAIVGMTGSGKSVLARHLFSAIRCRRAILDHKGDQTYPGAATARGAAAFARAWADGHQVVRFVPLEGTPEEYGDVYALLFADPAPTFVWCDELYGPGDANSAPRAMRIYLTQGRTRRKGHLGLTQRPVRVCAEALTEAEHLFVFYGGLRPRDLRPVADELGMDWRELQAELERLEPHGFLWRDRRAGTLRACPPLPVAYLR